MEHLFDQNFGLEEATEYFHEFGEEHPDYRREKKRFDYSGDGYGNTLPDDDELPF